LEPILYFAYGRNMSAAVMAQACPAHRYLGPAELREHRLAFTRRSLRTGTGVADILTTPGHSVWGALYELDSETELTALDQKEGSGWAYARRQVWVTLERSARERAAFAYAVLTHDAAHVQPSPEYLAALLTGARERGLPDGYLNVLRTTIARP
jgi:gamma-glutamylcyclotransferase (GGCT)/AIG2-like uncharacterized protein YtfP